MSDNVISNNFESPLCFAKIQIITSKGLETICCELDKEHDGNHTCYLSGFSGDSDGMPKAPVRVAITWNETELCT